jgi:hypothetical protein
MTIELCDSCVSSVAVRRVPVTVRCIEGCLWVTHEGDPADHVLKPGEEFVAARRGRLVVLGLARSRAAVSGGPDADWIVAKR